ncbi:Hypothetical predicted protein [Pelobates cultripes]|uniref:Uncharacterized protein n=1 Tax=Pelobates cultripes TaxID=61616 RepID=A0AAD1S926_PELCU|nr:Hypothetical predicted protein [Pelobates cultripes]
MAHMLGRLQPLNVQSIPPSFYKVLQIGPLVVSQQNAVTKYRRLNTIRVIGKFDKYQAPYEDRELTLRFKRWSTRGDNITADALNVILISTSTINNYTHHQHVRPNSWHLESWLSITTGSRGLLKLSCNTCIKSSTIPHNWQVFEKPSRLYSQSMYLPLSTYIGNAAPTER